jgi:hypothetical protein
VAMDGTAGVKLARMASMTLSPQWPWMALRA